MSIKTDWKSLDYIYDHECTRCDLHRDVRNVCIGGRGKFEDRILFIAEAPGDEEDRVGLPLVGKAGKIFDQITTAVGLDSQYYYATNVVKCRPPGNRTPTQAEVQSCRLYLLREISFLKPRMIVLLGSQAIKAFFGKASSVRAFRGKITDWNGYQVFCTFHPSSVNYEPYNLNLIIDDMNILINHLNGDGKSAEGIDRTYIYSSSNDRYHASIRYISRYSVMANDIETNKLDMYSPSFKILSTAFSVKKNTGVGILLDHRESVTHSRKILLDIQERVMKGEHTLVGHNFKFDLLGYRAYGIEYRGPIADTMVMSHLLDENNPDKSLENLTIRDLGLPPFKHRVDRNNMDNEKAENVLDYNCEDGDRTLQLYIKYLSQIEDQGMLPLFQYQMELLHMLVDIEWSGWAIDFVKFRSLREEYDNKISVLADRIYRYSGKINLNSPKQKARFLFEELNLPITEYTSGGVKGDKQPSTSKPVLKKLLWNLRDKNKINILKDILEYSNLVKRRTFFDQIKVNIKKDRKIHASYRQTKIIWGEVYDEEGGTVTGRLSCKNPNVQQIPRDGDIKKLFCSSHPDGILVQLDYSQMELRVLAEVSGDRKMQGIFADDKIDIHTRVASWPGVFNKPEDQITTKERKFTKQVNFGIAYMIGPEGLANKLSEEVGHHVEKEEARRLIDGWFSEFPQVKSWIDRTRRELIRYGEVANLMGRKRRLANTNPSMSKGREGIRQGINFLIQSLASDITLYRATELWRWLLRDGVRSRIVGLVHDAVIVDCPREEVMRVALKMKKVFENQEFEKFGFTMKVPLKVEIKAGPSWGETQILGKEKTWLSTTKLTERQ